MGKHKLQGEKHVPRFYKITLLHIALGGNHRVGNALRKVFRITINKRTGQLKMLRQFPGLNGDQLNIRHEHRL